MATPTRLPFLFQAVTDAPARAVLAAASAHTPRRLLGGAAMALFGASVSVQFALQARTALLGLLLRCHFLLSGLDTPNPFFHRELSFSTPRQLGREG